MRWRYRWSRCSSVTCIIHIEGWVSLRFGSIALQASLVLASLHVSPIFAPNTSKKRTSQTKQNQNHKRKHKRANVSSHTPPPHPSNTIASTHPSRTPLRRSISSHRAFPPFPPLQNPNVHPHISQPPPRPSSCVSTAPLFRPHTQRIDNRLRLRHPSLQNPSPPLRVCDAASACTPPGGAIIRGETTGRARHTHPARIARLQFARLFHSSAVAPTARLQFARVTASGAGTSRRTGT